MKLPYTATSKLSNLRGATPRSVINSYDAITHVPLRAVAAETLMWTIPGLLLPTRRSHPPGRLLFFAGLNYWAILSARKRIEADPLIVNDTRWLLRQSCACWLRYIAYLGCTPRRSYWRNGSDNIAFFSQPWMPIALWGAGKGPGAALLAGPIHGYAFYLCGAWANGEPIIPPREVRSLIVGVSNTAIRTGVVCWAIFRLLRRASIEAEAEREALRDRLAVEEEERALRELSVPARAEVTAALLRVRGAVHRYLPRDLQSALVPILDNAISRPWVNGAAASSAATLIEAVATMENIEVTVTGDDPALDEKSIGVLEALIHTALDNARVHGGVDEVSVDVSVLEGRISVRIADEGRGLRESVALASNHGLGKVRTYLRDLQGDLHLARNGSTGAVVESWWALEGQ